MSNQAGEINLVAHYYDPAANSDKVYIASVRREGKDWVVIGKWGRRGKRISSQVKLRTHHEFEAYQEQRNIFNVRIKEGYKDIDDPSYTGPVKRNVAGIRENLEPEQDSDPAPFAPVQPPEPPAKAKAKVPVAEVGFVAVCLDNKGIEEFYDMDVEYVFEIHADESMIWVYDKFGEKRECFCARFEIRKGR